MCPNSILTLAPKYLYRDYFKATVFYYLGTWTLRVQDLTIGPIPAVSAGRLLNFADPIQIPREPNTPAFRHIP